MTNLREISSHFAKYKPHDHCMSPFIYQSIYVLLFHLCSSFLNPELTRAILNPELTRVILTPELIRAILNP